MTLDRTVPWAETTLSQLHSQLADRVDTSTSELPQSVHEAFCDLFVASGPNMSLGEACVVLEQLEQHSDKEIQAYSAEHQPVSVYTRIIYSDSRLIHALLELRHPHRVKSEKEWEDSVVRLDMAIVIAGAPGNGRLDLILETINRIQTIYLPIATNGGHIAESHELRRTVALPQVQGLASQEVRSISPPSITSFLGKLECPFMLRGFLSDWPALTYNYWGSSSYLLRVAGRGRIVPIEIGKDYRESEWTQKMMPWEMFLRGIGILHSKSDDISTITDADSPLYLAQHNLLTQFPKLRSDIVIPDYAYSSPHPPSSFPDYKPPGNEEQLVINAWLGPAGTVSPAHTDPYFNCYGQVVGRKTVWLAPPFREEMYPFSDPAAPHTTRLESENHDRHSDSAPLRRSTPSLSNTSLVDVFNPSQEKEFPLFKTVVRPQSFCSTLEPGDMLYIPPGWWHAMRSEDTSFSVSIWF